jgi:hypothetical protein
MYKEFGILFNLIIRYVKCKYSDKEYSMDTFGSVHAGYQQILLCKECSVMEQMKPTFRDLVE